MAPRPKTIPLKEFADDHGLTLRRIQQWIAEGMPYREVSGARRVVRADANRWVREREREQERETVMKAIAPSSLEEAEKRKAIADAQLAELKLERERGNLIPLALHGERLARILERVRARLVAIPGKVAPQLIGVETAPAAQALVNDAVSEALEELSR